MKILVAPLNWGLGHASRCIPLINQYLQKGDEVVIGGDGESGTLLRKTFPQLRFLQLASLRLRYDEGTNQHHFIIRSIPTLIRFTIADHYALRHYLECEHFDLVISDNRFGLFSRNTRCEYITHQLYPQMPYEWRILQIPAHFLHACIYHQFDACLIPDYADARNNLSGKLSHRRKMPKHVRYIGPLSRFNSSMQKTTPDEIYDVVAVLSGLEPQRTILEQQIIQTYEHNQKKVLIIRGKVTEPTLWSQHGLITLVNTLPAVDIYNYLLHATTILARSGYSTIMDLDAIGGLHRAQLYPTPGQSEQEYLYNHIQKRISEHKLGEKT